VFIIIVLAIIAILFKLLYQPGKKKDNEVVQNTMIVVPIFPTTEPIGSNVDNGE